MIKKFKTWRLEKKLDAWDERVKTRIEGSQTPFHRWYDFLNETEQREYSRLAKEHFELTGTYKYFNPKVDAVVNDPNSPKAYTTVDHNRSTKVSFEYGEDGRLYKLVDGEREDQYGCDPESFFGDRLTHREFWEVPLDELEEKLNEVR